MTSDDSLIEAMARAHYVSRYADEWENTMLAEKDSFLRAMRAALTALRDQGYAVVPREPTEAMLTEGASECWGENPHEDARDCWTAMLEAAEEGLGKP